MTNNKILALKYRPQEFKDLIGQEVMAQTITNAIEQGKTPNAYLLTGIRGVGKTSTARIIAKSLNCLGDEKNKCSPEKFCTSCEEIVNSNHIDILEMDAASKTGIDDVRELIENSKYSPTSGKYKIFIIDEVHMLSKQAFNGLLKTLEEPPPRLKFILATTEVRKIPVTILSRCQRFDLKRVNLEKLITHLKNIAEKEKGNISDKAINVIARTSEGSVRDAISLLDRALISKAGNKNIQIQDQDVREMLGLADKSKLIILFKEILNGDEKKSLDILRDLIISGLDTKNFLNDILEIIYLFSRKNSLGPLEKDMNISESESQLINDFSKNISVQDLNIFWQLTIKTIDDINIVSNENLLLEMFVMQLIHIKDINNNYDKKEQINSLSDTYSGLGTLEKDKEQEDNLSNTVISKAKNQLKNTDQLKQENIIKNSELVKSEKFKNKIQSFQDLINLANKEKEVELKYDLERNVKLVSFNYGKIDISFNEKLNKNFIKLLTEKLILWTGERWIISLSKNDGAKSIYQQKADEKSQKLSYAKDSKVVKKFLSDFNDAKLIEIVEDKDA